MAQAPFKVWWRNPEDGEPLPTARMGDREAPSFEAAVGLAAMKPGAYIQRIKDRAILVGGVWRSHETGEKVAD